MISNARREVMTNKRMVGGVADRGRVVSADITRDSGVERGVAAGRAEASR